jgi:hypothetical protein
MCIPDISYHLIFCFLSLRELTIIAQCNREWNRLVTTPSFVNMFRHQDVLEFANEDSLISASQSPFRNMIHAMRINYESKQNSTILHLIHFPRLVFLDLILRFKIDEQYTKITPIFDVLAPRLHVLKVITKAHSIYQYWTSHSFDEFQHALSLLTSLQSLTLTEHNECNIFKHFSFLSSMKQLTTFSCDSIHYLTNHEELLNNIFLCSKLSFLDLGYYFEYGDSDAKTKEFCRLFKKSKLKHIGTFSFDDRFMNHSMIVNEMSFLQTIGVTLDSQSSISSCSPFSKWIRQIEINDILFSDEDVNSVIALTNLKSLDLIRCSIGKNQLEALIHGISQRLETLCIKTGHFIVEISLPCLSQIIHLKSLKLKNIFIEDLRKFELLYKCKQLEMISISYHSDLKDSFGFRIDGSNMREAFKIPCKLLPMLKVIEI